MRDPLTFIGYDSQIQVGLILEHYEIDCDRLCRSIMKP